MDCLHRCFVVRFTHLIRDIFSVDDTVIAIDHKDGPHPAGSSGPITEIPFQDSVNSFKRAYISCFMMSS